MENCEAMTSSPHSFAYSYRLVKKCFLKIYEASKCHNFLIFQPISSGFHWTCLKNVTLSSEINLNLLWSSSLMGSLEPAGAYIVYTKIQRYMYILNEPSEPPIIPDGDVYLEVDNEQTQQMVGKSCGRIREGSSIRLDICTTVSCLQPVKKTELRSEQRTKADQVA